MPLIMPLIMLLISCQAETPVSKRSSTQNLLDQVEAIEADESALFFQKAKAAAEADKTEEKGSKRKLSNTDACNTAKPSLNINQHDEQSLS